MAKVKDQIEGWEARRRLIIELRENRGMTYADIGREMGITRNRARLLYLSAVRRNERAGKI